MRIDFSTNYPHAFSPNHHIAKHAHTQKSFSQSGYDVVEISEAARERFRSTAQRADAADMRVIAKSYEPLVREILSQMEASNDTHSRMIAELKQKHLNASPLDEDIIISTLVETLFM